MHTLTVVLIAAFFAAMLYIGYRTHLARNKTEGRENFLIGGRNVPAWLVGIGATMGWVDAFQFSFNPAIGFDNGLIGYCYIAAGMGMMMLLAYFAPHMRQVAAKHNLYMMGNYFSAIYSSRTGALVGGTMGFGFVAWLIMQLLVGGQILASVSGFSYPAMVTSMSLVTLIYMLVGGYLGSTKTDLWQFFIFLLYFLLTVGILFIHLPHWVAPLSSLSSMPTADFISLITVGLCSGIVAPDVWQRIYSAESAPAARKSIFFMAALFTPIVVVAVSLGMYVKTLGVITSSNDIAGAIMLHVVPSWFLPVATLALMAAIMSTMASCLFCAASSIVGDIAIDLGWLNQTKRQNAIRITMMVLMPLAVGIALSPLNLLSLGMVIMGCSMPLLPLTLCLLFGWRVSERAAFYNTAVSVAVFALGVVFNIYTGPLATLPLIVATGTLLLFEGLFRKSKR